MEELLNRKLQQMHSALAALRTEDLSTIQPVAYRSEAGTFATVDFNRDSDPPTLANAAAILVANIASLKDHLRVWCKKKAVPFHGDALINSNRSVALIHDLWNVDKHAELNSPPRSGTIPALKGISTVMVISASGAGSSAFFQIDPFTGSFSKGTTGGGSVSLALSAQIVDERGNTIGDFQSVCSEAAEAWEAELKKAGVPLV